MAEEIRFVYVAGPYSRGDPVINTRNAIMAGEELVELGFLPFIPHLTHLWHLIFPHEVEFWYAYDNEWISRCDALLRLPGESPGADAEVKLIESQGKPVFYSIEELK